VSAAARSSEASRGKEALLPALERSFEAGKHTLEGRIVAPILYSGAGMRHSRPVAPDASSHFREGEAELNMG
jgi:hypothetical protein